MVARKTYQTTSNGEGRVKTRPYIALSIHIRPQRPPCLKGAGFLRSKKTGEYGRTVFARKTYRTAPNGEGRVSDPPLLLQFLSQTQKETEKTLTT